MWERGGRKSEIEREREIGKKDGLRKRLLRASELADGGF